MYYIDAELQATAPWPGPLTAGWPLWLGTMGHATETYQGSFDDLKLYNRAMSGPEIRTLRDADSAASPHLMSGMSLGPPIPPLYVTAPGPQGLSRNAPSSGELLRK